MFYYFNQPCTASFPIGLVKTESDFIVRSDETGLERWMLVVAVVTDPPDSKETDFGSSDQEASGVVLVSCHGNVFLQLFLVTLVTR